MRIFVAEHNQELGEVLHLLLRREGFIACVFECGEELVRAAVQQPPRLIIIEASTPDDSRMSGIECIQTLRSRAATASVPIIVHSSNCDGDAIESALLAGASDYVVKSHMSWNKFLALVRDHANST